jgi:hypothetical protein
MDEGRHDRPANVAGAAAPPRPWSSAAVGAVVVIVGTLGWSVWFGWRLSHPVPHPLWALAVTIEGLGVITGLTVAVAALHHRRRIVSPAGWRATDGSPYLCAIAELAGRAPAEPLTDAPRHAALGAHRLAWARQAGVGDRAFALALLEAPRRLVYAGTLAAGLLLGAATHGRPTMTAVAGAAVGISALSVGTWLLSGRTIRPGDRTLWSFAAMGVLLRSHRVDTGERAFAGAASVERAGIMGLVVVMNLAVSLRGISDRWTHGLPDMAHDDRVGAMSMAIVMVLAAIAALGRLPDPEPVDDPVDEVVLPRRLEERSARQTALAATAAVAIVGLVAGVLPGAVDAGDRRSGERTEVVSQLQRGVGVVEADLEPDAAEVGDAVIVDTTQMTPEHSDEP